jgi:L-threonylcarbamoyladenylate synthase
MKTIKANKANKENIEEIITALKNGAVLVLPTDTVYGLVCDAANESAVEKIFEIKKRDKTKPLAVFVNDIEQAKEFAEISAEQEKFLKDNWPGATTFILPARPRLAGLIYKENTIGMRVPDYNLIKDIFEEFSRPLAQTSANISGEGDSVEISKIKSQFENEDILIVDGGDLPKRKPSVIIDLSKEETKILRK